MLSLIITDEYMHTHIQDQYASYNFAEDQSDPTPPTYSNDFHGTSCAGEIAMVRNNNQCGAGVAHGCNIGGNFRLHHVL